MCHGEDGQQELTGTYNLVTSTMTIDQIIVITKEGKSTMMPYDAILSNKDLVDVSRYVLSMQVKNTQ
jgi:mono/diheme cytochrome c family protein